AVQAPTVITITETECPPPSAYVDFSPVYQFDPPNLVLAKPATVRIPWSNSQQTGSNLSIFLSNGAGFERVADSYTNAGFMQGSFTHFGSAFSGTPKTDAQ